MADEKAKIVTDATGPGSGPAPAQPEVDAQVSKQEQSAPEAPTPDKAEAPAQEAPAQDKAADAPKEQKTASVSVFNFSEIMAEKKATERPLSVREKQFFPCLPWVDGLGVSGTGTVPPASARPPWKEREKPPFPGLLPPAGRRLAPWPSSRP